MASEQTETDNVVEMRPPSEHDTCDCGDPRIKVAVVVNKAGHLEARTLDGECASCGVWRQLPAVSS